MKLRHGAVVDVTHRVSCVQSMADDNWRKDQVVFPRRRVIRRLMEQFRHLKSFKQKSKEERGRSRFEFSSDVNRQSLPVSVWKTDQEPETGPGFMQDDQEREMWAGFMGHDQEPETWPSLIQDDQELEMRLGLIRDDQEPETWPGLMWDVSKSSNHHSSQCLIQSFWWWNNLMEQLFMSVLWHELLILILASFCFTISQKMMIIILKSVLTTDPGQIIQSYKIKWN